jgi:membrane protein DedA with SNARE-associated domain
MTEMASSLMAYLQSLEGAPAYALVFGLLVGSGFGLPVNEDILLVAAAALTLKGVMDPVGLIAAAWCGVVIADLLIFHWGRVFGARLLRQKFVGRWLPERKLLAMQGTMVRWGPGYIFVARFMPGVRSAVYFAAGSLKMPYRHMVVFDGAAALVELPLLVYGVRYLGGQWHEIVGMIQNYQGLAGAALLLLLLGAWMAIRLRSRAKP